MVCAFGRLFIVISSPPFYTSLTFGLVVDVTREKAIWCSSRRKARSMVPSIGFLMSAKSSRMCTCSISLSLSFHIACVFD